MEQPRIQLTLFSRSAYRSAIVYCPLLILLTFACASDAEERFKTPSRYIPEAYTCREIAEYKPVH